MLCMFSTLSMIILVTSSQLQFTLNKVISRYVLKNWCDIIMVPGAARVLKRWDTCSVCVMKLWWKLQISSSSLADCRPNQTFGQRSQNNWLEIMEALWGKLWFENMGYTNNMWLMEACCCFIELKTLKLWMLGYTLWHFHSSVKSI